MNVSLTVMGVLFILGGTIYLFILRNQCTLEN